MARKQQADVTDAAPVVTAPEESLGASQNTAEAIIKQLEEDNHTASDSTNAFSQDLVEARVEAKVFPAWHSLHLDNIYFQHPYARLLLRPKIDEIKVEATGLDVRDAGEWVDVDTNDPNEESTKVLVCTPDHDDTGYKISHDISLFYLILPTDSDTVELVSTFHPVVVERLDRNDLVVTVEPKQYYGLEAGIWRLKDGVRPLYEIQILPRIKWRVSPGLPNPARTKRTAPTEAGPSKKVKLPDSQGVIVNQGPGEVADRPFNQVVPRVDNTIAKLKDGETVFVGVPPQGYWLKRESYIFENQHSSVFKASAPGPGGKKSIVVKLLKTSGFNGSAMYASKAWTEEMKNHLAIAGHPSIVQVFGGDGRFNTIYMEHVDAQSLEAQTGLGDRFSGNRADALKVLQHVASALEFIHAKGFLHNDIKPGNILYSRERGPVLIDLGLARPITRRIRGGGTPWYLAVELLGDWLYRGPASDVWALGVVGLWLLGYIALPEKSHLGWNVHHIHVKGPPTDASRSARRAMTTFINHISAAVSKLSCNRKLERLVAKMLEIESRDRIKVASLCSELGGLKLTPAATCDA